MSRKEEKKYKTDKASSIKTVSYTHLDVYKRQIQHQLQMKNNIRTGWCRTTPLWGRGLSMKATGAVSYTHLLSKTTFLDLLCSPALSDYRYTGKILPRGTTIAPVSYTHLVPKTVPLLELFSSKGGTL